MPRELQFNDCKTAKAKPDKFTSVTVDTAKVIANWRLSVLAFEWLDENGKIKPADQLTERERQRRQEVEGAAPNGGPFEKPVLGIGMMDHVEFGSGRALFLTLANLGYDTLPVHIPVSCRGDFNAFIIQE